MPRKPKVAKAKPELVPVDTAAIGAETAAKEKKPKQVNDPAKVAAAWELRDRWLEQINQTPLMGCGKYEVTRLIDQTVRVDVEPVKLLNAA